MFIMFLFMIATPAFAACTNGGNPTDPGDCSYLGSNSSTNSNPGGIEDIFITLNHLLNSALPVLIALGVVYFVWGVVQFVIGDSEEAKKKGKDGIIYGLIGLAVIIGLWGLVNIVSSTFGIDKNNIAPTKAKLNQLLPQ